MIGLIDYGAGNMQSVANALSHLGIQHAVCLSPVDLDRVDKIIMPGVGHFGPATKQLLRVGLLDAIRGRAAYGTPLLGICLGLQLLFDSSEEEPGAPGLGLLSGKVTRLRTACVPHMGWNKVRSLQANPLTNGEDQTHCYFAHSFAAEGVWPEQIIATTELDGQQIPAIVGRDNIWGVQFHPEKSSHAGLAMLRRFAEC